METGGNGVNGALVLRHANKENNQEHENAMLHPPSMVGNHVLEKQRKSAFVTRKFLAQVNNQYYLIIFTYHKQVVILAQEVQ